MAGDQSHLHFDSNSPLRSLVDTSCQMAAELNPVQALWKLVCSLRNTLGVDRAGVYEYERSREVLSLIVGVDAKGQPQYSGAEINVLQSRGPMAQVANRTIPHFYTDDIRRDCPDLTFDSRVRAHAIVPICTGAELVGVLNVDTIQADRPLSPEIIRPLFLFAGLAAPPLFALYQKRERERVEVMRRNIYRDVFFAATNGKIRLCTLEEIEVQWPVETDPLPINREGDIAAVRDLTRRVAEAAGLDEERASDLLICVSEAATNALVHARGGVVRAAHAYGAVRVRITDSGRGIALEQLPDAALRPGWSQAPHPSMGQGFVLIHKLADSVLLHTGPTGTTVIVEMRVEAEDRLPSSWGVLL